MPSEPHTRAPTFWRHPRSALLAWLAVGMAVATTPLIVARDASWLIAWADLALLALVSIATFKCFATTRRLRGQERTSWLCVSVAYALYAIAHLIWSGYELLFGHQAPLPSLADAGYLTAPLIMIAGIWLYRASSPTLSTALVQLGNTGVLVSAILLANQIVLKQALSEAAISPSEYATHVAYGVVATTAFTFALFSICFSMRGRRRLVMMPLLIALGSLAIGDYVAIFEFSRNTYTLASYSSIAYIVTFSLGSWAAFEQDYLARFPAPEHDRQSIDRAARQWETLLPVAAIVGLVAVALTHAESLDADLLPDASIALLLFIASIALRDWWSQRVEAELREATRTHEALLQRSERRLLEKNQQLSDANRELSAEMIARRNVEEELRHSQKLEAIGQLTGGVAHDFNNLLAVIIGNAELLEQALATDSADRCYTQEITAAARRGAALTGRLLAFSRKQSLDPRPIEIHRLLESMTGLLERTLGERIQLRFEIASDVATCMVDGAQLENAILNLAINARDAMHDGGSITIEAANLTLSARDVASLPGAAAGDYVALAVRDTGTGMSEFVRARAFDPFFTTKEPGEGSGLGLSMVYGFVRQSGGHISITSEVGAGTQVQLYIPRTDLASETPDDGDGIALAAGRGESVLVVEDDPALRNMIVSQLQKLSYRVHSASNGSEALAIAQQAGSIDLLLSDVILPGDHSGPELADEIAARMPAIRILLMSGYAADALERRASSAGYAKPLQKPFSMGKLAQEIRTALSA